jgi:NTE family protein
MQTLGDWLAEQPFTLAMSSGFFGFFAHTGMLEALVEAGVRPRRVVGASAGALVAAPYAVGVAPSELARELLSLRREDFWDPGLGFGFLRGRMFRTRLRNILGDARIEEAAVPLGIVVHDVLAHRAVPRRTGLIAEVVCASCAVPGLFQPVWIDGRPHLDGGILDRPALTALDPDERTLHHHLASKSPWRRWLDVPRKSGLLALVLDGLPRSGPFKLEVGAEAYRRAREATQRALESAVDGAVLRVDADH